MTPARGGLITFTPLTRQAENPLQPDTRPAHGPGLSKRGPHVAKKPKWVVEKERSKRAAAAETLWLFGLHAVRDALVNPRREKLRLVVTKNAADKLADAIKSAGLEPEIADPRKFPVPLDPGSVHQGAALEVKPLDWGPIDSVCMGDGDTSAGVAEPTDGTSNGEDMINDISDVRVITAEVIFTNGQIHQRSTLCRKR